MNNIYYAPEGFMEEKKESLSAAILERAINTKQILEARAVMCDSDHNLIVDLGDIRGIIPREEAAIGIREGQVSDIAVLSRAGKQICFRVDDLERQGTKTVAKLSRLSAQKDALEYMLENYRCGDVINAKVTHLEPFGAFVDIGCGIIGLINIENISVSRISHPKDRFYVGQNIKVVIKEIDRIQKRFSLSHKELLGTWQENADLFSIGQTVCGTVRSVEEYGIFIELTPNLAGLAENKNDAIIGQKATVYIKNIIPEKMKIKLSIIDNFECNEQIKEPRYFIKEGHIDVFTYSPPCCGKLNQTIFQPV